MVRIALKTGQPRGAVLLLAAAAVAAGSPAVKADQVAASSGAEVGTIDVPAFSYPPSVLSSEELKRAYARSLAGPGNGTITPPTDPKRVAIMEGYRDPSFRRNRGYRSQL